MQSCWHRGASGGAAPARPAAGSERAMSGEAPGEQGEVPQESTGSSEPAELLGELAVVRRRTRSARHAYWFPLVLFGLLTCAAAPLYVSAAEPPYASAAIPRAIVSSSQGGEPLVLSGVSIGGGGFYLCWYWLVGPVGGVLLSPPWGRVARPPGRCADPGPRLSRDRCGAYRAGRRHPPAVGQSAPVAVAVAGPPR